MLAILYIEYRGFTAAEMFLSCLQILQPLLFRPCQDYSIVLTVDSMEGLNPIAVLLQIFQCGIPTGIYTHTLVLDEAYTFFLSQLIRK